MTDNQFPPRHTAEAHRVDEEFVKVLEVMVEGSEAITARAVARRMSTGPHASTLTRDRWRAGKINEAEEQRLRKAAENAPDEDGAEKLPSSLDALDVGAMRSFLKAAQMGHLGRAASDLGISQPALTRRLQTVERQFGSALLVRHGKGVALTAAGSAILERFEASLAALDMPVRAPSASIASGQLTICVPGDIGWLVAPTIVRRLKAQLANVDLLLTEADGPQVYNDLRNGRLAMAVVADPLAAPDLKAYPLFQDEVGVIGPPSSELGEASSPLTARDAANLPLIVSQEGHPIRRHAAQLAAQAGSRLTARLHAAAFSTVIALVRAGHGYSLATRTAVREYLDRGSLIFRPLDRPAVNVSYCAVTCDTAAQVYQTIAGAVTDLIPEPIFASVRDDLSDARGRPRTS